MAKDSRETGKFWDKSWNIAFGCTPVGAGCLNCWAKANHERWRGGSGERLTGLCAPCYARPFNEVCVHLDHLDIPLRRKKPTVYAVNFSGDPYHEAIPDEMLDKVAAIEALCPQHTFIHLTKRWERRAEWFKASSTGLTSRRESVGIACWTFPKDPQMIGGALRAGQGEWPLPNVWQGVSVSTQAELDAATPHLLATPAAVRVLSLEPMLEEMDLSSCIFDRRREVKRMINGPACLNPDQADSAVGLSAGWVIVGCETGPNRRPCKLEWIESIVAQCKAAGVPVWVKGVDLHSMTWHGSPDKPQVGVSLRSRVSHNMAEWPASLRVREMPDGQ